MTRPKEIVLRALQPNLAVELSPLWAVDDLSHRKLKNEGGKS